MRKIQIVSLSKKEEMREIFFEYLREISKFDKTITFDKSGLPIYKWFDFYWSDKDRYPFYLIVDGCVAGIALIRELGQGQFEVAEYYICPEYRKDENAIWFINQITSLFDGEFVLSTDLINIRAMKFWNKVATFFKNSSSKEDETRKYWTLKN